MNIFVLHTDPATAARHHCDKHVVKMHTEGIQMLVSVFHRYGIDHRVLTKADTLHRGGYPNHPCTRWAGDSYANFAWLLQLTRCLCEEHTYRYGTLPHSATQLRKAEQCLHELEDSMVSLRAGAEPTPHAQAMPSRYRHKDAVTAYRQYYIGEKGWATWSKNRPAPAWWSPNNSGETSCL